MVDRRAYQRKRSGNGPREDNVRDITTRGATRFPSGYPTVVVAHSTAHGP